MIPAAAEIIQEAQSRGFDVSMQVERETILVPPPDDGIFAKAKPGPTFEVTVVVRCPRCGANVTSTLEIAANAFTADVAANLLLRSIPDGECECRVRGFCPV